ncbi:hypothetical protein MVEN_00941000 [Mycena venus]|uniref:Uncharacterized protein n=1 Tax=Mycena venus TaxID=2733690 RepID=A0A8H6YAD2_9AGAR|nr:hypothetical protein MVEN_00941000 [Mycena venus]
MDDKTHVAPPESTTQCSPGTTGSICHAAVVNSSARDIIMTNCTTTSNLTFTNAPAVSSDFRTILLGDTDLQHEIRVNYDTGVVQERTREWQNEITRYKSVRHPNIVQIWATASAHGIHATLFHNDLIPLRQYVGRYQHSPCVQVYIYGYCGMEFKAASDYFFSSFHQRLSMGNIRKTVAEP